MNTIGQRRAYPRALRVAAVKAMSTKSGLKRQTSEIAADFNIHKSTLASWARQAKVARQQPAQLTAYQANVAAVKAYNTPTPCLHDGTPVSNPSDATHLNFRGKVVAL